MSQGSDPSKRLSLRANFSWTFAGNAVNAACQWGVLAVLARLAAGDQSALAVGQFVLGLAITAPVMAIAMLQLRNLLVTDAKGDFEFADYFGLRLFWTTVGLAVICGIVAFKIYRGLDMQAAIVVILVGVSKCADSLSDIVRGLFQRMERMDYSGKSLMLRGPAALLAMGLTFWSTQNLVLAVGALAAMWFVTLIAYDLVHARRLLGTGDHATVGSRLKPRVHRRTAARLTWIAFPLGIVMSIISLQTNIPRYVIEEAKGLEALGYFGALAYPMVAAMMIASAMGQSASPRLSRCFIDDLPGFRKLLARISVMAAVTGVSFIAGAWALGEPILTILYGAQYAEYNSAFVLLAIATAIQLVATCGGYALTAARYIRIQVLLVSISCLVTTAAALILVPRFGVRGGAMAVIATSTTMLLLFFGATAWALHRRGREIADGSKADGDAGNSIKTSSLTA
ncbi:MAG: oligosaccharide flippase family protein [Planctomycetota bacterium]|jgi:O-antigen/teichoic acid export membrane protein